MRKTTSLRILLIIPYGGVGGMERLALNLYHHYRALGHTVKVIKFVRLSGDIVNFGDDEIALSEKDLAEMKPLRRYTFYLSIPWAIASAIRKYKITHSIGFGDMANLFSSLSPSTEFKIASIHALKSVELSAKNVLNRLFRFAYLSTYRRFKRVVCISYSIRRDMLDNCSYAFPDNLEVIYNPHDVIRVQTMAAQILDSNELRLFSDSTIVFLGRLSIQKSPWHLIKAFRAVLGRGIAARLLFIGDGDPEVTRYVKTQVEAYGIGDRVVFLGRRENPYKYLARADVLALSSHYEGTPNVIVEAIALGVPVVSSQCTDGIAELMSLTPEFVQTEMAEVEAGIITPNLYHGVLGIPADDIDTPAEAALADALAAVMTDSRHRERLLAARAELLAKFDLACSAQRYLEPAECSSMKGKA